MSEFVCIVCPASCRLKAEQSAEGVKITGNTCIRGAEYGLNEFTAPKRMLTATVLCEGGTLPRLPVISGAELPKARLTECLDALYKTKVNAPVKCGDIIMRDICGTGVDMLASRSMSATLT